MKSFCFTVKKGTILSDKHPAPGISREHRISDEGLRRLEQHLRNGPKMNPAILKQWVKRYGEQARILIRQYNQYTDELDLT